MTSSNNTADGGTNIGGGEKPHLIVISPPNLANSNIVASLFADAAPLPASAPGQQSKTLANLPRFQISSPEAILSDISLLEHQDFNATLLSARADVVLIIIDAAFGLEKKDFWAKSLACLAATPDIVIAINNMSSADFSKSRYDSLCEEFNDHSVELDCRNVHFIPIDLGTTDNLQTMSAELKWHDGEPLMPLLSRLLSSVPSRTGHDQAEQESDQFAVYLSWLSKNPMLPGRSYRLHSGAHETKAHVSTLKYRFNPETMGHQAAKRLLAGNVGYGNISLETAISFAPFAENRQAGSFTLSDPQSAETVAIGMIRHGLRRATNIRWQALEIDKQARATTKQQKPCVLWFTGLSGSGKSTVASLVEKKLHAKGKHTYVLDGDNVRHGLCRDLGFTDADRVENLRRISETAKLFVDAGLIVLVSFISPFRAERKAARQMFGRDEFIEIFVDTPLEVCEARDPKGLYKKARAGQLKNFTGLDSPYEPPKTAEIILSGGTSPPEDLVETVMVDLAKNGLI